MSIDNKFISTSKISTLFLFFFFTFIFFGCTVFYLFYKLDEKCDLALKQVEALTDQCSTLIKSNASLQEEILSLKVPTIRVEDTLDLCPTGSVFFVNDALAHFISFSCILFALLSLGVISYFSYCVLLKYLLVFSKTFAFKSLFGSFSYPNFYKFFVDNQITLPSEFSYLDQFNNTIKVLFSEDQKSAEVCIKLCDSDVFVPLVDILCKYHTLIISEGQGTGTITPFDIRILEAAEAASALSAHLPLFN